MIACGEKQGGGRKLIGEKESFLARRSPLVFGYVQQEGYGAGQGSFLRFFAVGIYC